jgi:hypothetical protein
MIKSALAAFAVLVIGSISASAELLTECTRPEFCYCIESDLNGKIDMRVKELRALLKTQRDQGKATGYLSIPISTAEGSYQPLNHDVAASIKTYVEERFGSNSTWLLNTADPFGTAKVEEVLPKSATGADYMLMWTRVLEGGNGLGPDFDFVYFAGPSDFARKLKFDEHNDMAKMNSYYDTNNPKGYDDKPLDKTLFRNYYGLRASVAFSKGGHDEWNIVRLINERRRVADKDGILKQLAVLFDGRAVPPPMYEAQVPPGYARPCPTH